jgi:hypothetical protein
MRFFRSIASLLTAGVTLAFAVPALAQQPSSLPDVIGIRPGMPAGDAYNILKAKANGAKIGISQQMLQGIQQPVPVLMSLRVMGSSPAETIVVFLTFPPQKQVVWAVRRTLTYEPGKELTKAAIMEGLRQKYGTPIIANGATFWDFDEQGGNTKTNDMIFNNCVGRANLSEPQDFEAPQPITPLPYLQPPSPACGAYVSVRAELNNAATTATGTLAGAVTVYLEDDAMAIRSRQGWQAVVNGDDDARRKQELDKANHQQRPTF